MSSSDAPSKQSPQLDLIEQAIDYTFRSKDLLRVAMTHRSFGSEASVVENNQRLEFLGDAVLQLIITQELYARFSDAGEGPLTKARAQLVNRRTLASQAQRIDLGRHLTMSRGEELSGGRERPAALADAFEALVGAMFLDSDFSTLQGFIVHFFSRHLGELNMIPNLDNPKGDLQEYLQAHSSAPPHYELISISGPDHDRQFECAVFHDGKELGKGEGKSKKEAEFEAALRALEKIKNPM